MRKAHDVGSDPQTPTLAEVVRRAVEVCDHAHAGDGLTLMLETFEDRDQPISSVAEVQRELAEAAGRADPQGDDPALVMARAVATYLAYRRTELRRDPGDLMRRAAQAEFDSRPPEHVAAWLASQGVEV